MKVRTEQLVQNLKTGLKPVYLISGDEPLQVMESTDHVRSACRNDGFEERIVFDVDAKFEWNLLEEAASSMSLFSTKRIIEIRLPSAKPGKQGSQTLKKLLEQKLEDTVIIIISGKLESAQKNSAWVKAIDKSGIIVQCWPINGRDLSAWVSNRFALKNMQTDKEVVDFICQRVEGNLLAAVQEIDKLFLILGDGKIEIEDLERCITDNSRYNVFELLDNALSGNKNRTMKIAGSLQSEGVEPVMVTWAFAKDLRVLADVSTKAVNIDAELGRHGVWKNRISLFKTCLNRHSTAKLKALLKSCSRIDQITKGVGVGNVWDELRTLSFLLAG